MSTPPPHDAAQLNHRFKLALLAGSLFLAFLALTAYLAHQELPWPAGGAGLGALVVLYKLLGQLGRP